jgi:hypothetical protein
MPRASGKHAKEEEEEEEEAQEEDEGEEEGRSAAGGRGALLCKSCDRFFNSAFQLKEHQQSKAHAKALAKKAVVRGTGNVLFVGQLPFETTEKELRGFFAAKLQHSFALRLRTDRTTGRFLGTCFLECEQASDVELALACHHLRFRDRLINVEKASLTGGKEKRGKEIQRLREEQQQSNAEAVGLLIDQVAAEHGAGFDRSAFDADVRQYLCTVHPDTARTALREFLQSSHQVAIGNKAAFLMSIVKRLRDGGVRKCFFCSSGDHVKADCPQRRAAGPLQKGNPRLAKGPRGPPGSGGSSGSNAPPQTQKRRDRDQEASAKAPKRPKQPR